VTAAGLTGVVITKNEEDRIARCLDSLAFCDELLVVDSHSTDRTRELAGAAGARVIERDWPGYGPQKAFAVASASQDWVLCLDADERLDERLRGEIEALRAAGFPGHAGWSAPRCSRYLGRWIRHGTWYPDRQLRLFDRRRGNWNDAPVHERVELAGSVGRLAGEILHEPYRALADHLRTIERYTDLAAERDHARGKRARALDLVTRPAWRFLRFYVLERGFLDGWRGLLLAYLAAHYVRLKVAKTLVLARGEQA